jgi:hypothetical protein
MISTHTLEQHFQHLSQDFQDVILEIHGIVAAINPNATERIDRNGISYFDAERGGPVTAGICQIFIKDDRLRLAFIHGALMPDPQHLLVKEGRLAKRYLIIKSYDTAPWEAIKALIEAHNRFDPYAYFQDHPFPKY